MTARQADAQVQPLAAVAQAVLAAVDRSRQLAQADLVEMGAELAHLTRTAGAAGTPIGRAYRRAVVVRRTSEPPPVRSRPAPGPSGRSTGRRDVTAEPQ